MARIGELDLADRLAPVMTPWVTQVGFGLLCAAAASMARAALDTIAPGAGPFALGYPAVLIATLFGRWPAGAITGAVTIVYSWYFTLPAVDSFAFTNPSDGPRLIVNTLSYGLIVAIAERFRRAVRYAVSERDREVAERDLFLQEFDHRVKNNFTLVAGLLDLQRRRTEDPATADALEKALARVESIARAHRHLYRGGSAPGTVEMDSYIHELCDALAESLSLHTALTLDCRVSPVEMARDRAVSIGLVINELVTNAVKHAFPGRDTGRITVGFGACEDGGWLLTVADDGVGMSEETLANGREGGLGQRLLDAFARQAGGTLDMESGPRGTTVRLALEP